MGPLQLFLVLALLGAVVVMGYLAVTDCAQAELVVLAGEVTGKTVEVREVERTVVVGGCPLCPGSKPETRVVKEKEEIHYLIVELDEGGRKELKWFAVEESVYHKVTPGTAVQVRYLRGNIRKTPCTPPQLVFLGS